MRFLPVNLDAVLVELDDLSQTLALLASLQAEPIAGVDDVVPAARTLLVTFRPAAVSRAELIDRISVRRLDVRVEAAGERIEIPVTYNGEDLEEVAGLLGISLQEVVRRHTGSDYTVAFTGFAPGFAYLSGGDASLNVPRRATPRTRIPAGAVGLAGSFSGVYPQASPGGWQIIGVTATRMWDLSRDRPALLQPGQRVRFVDAGPQTSASTAPAVPQMATMEPLSAPSMGGSALEVRQSGLQALFQDLGRHGQAGQGVSTSGAMDRASLRAANRLVGNRSDAACVEAVYGGLQVVCRGDAVVAVAGAQGPLELLARNGSRWPVPRHAPIALSDGDALLIGEPSAGIRSYVAVRGGFAVAPVLGSCATDTLANIGPRPLAAGDVLPIRPPAPGTVVGLPESAPADLPMRDEVVTLDVVMGPRTDWFAPESLELLATQIWTVTPQSNRVGVRLSGEQPLARTAAMQGAELPSEGTALGALQVPPNGQPVLFMADHPLTGGYPVIASVASYDIDRAGQLPIGARVRLCPISPDFARQLSMP